MRFRTKTYHPQANGMVERLHRQLKAGLSAATGAHWTESLPLVLLVKPAPLRPQSIDTFVHSCLKTSTHVFVRRDSVRRPLEPQYDVPYKVNKRMDKFFVLDKKGREHTVSIDRLKPAYLEGNPISLELSIPNNTQVTEYPLVLEEFTSTVKDTGPSVEPSKKTRFGQKVRFPENPHTYIT
ncbi:unnamed protein product [Trichobilharzia regenti]|nr:unnamed protein product [Trichobilharzia regenti]